ncbi:flgn protein [Lucifera butyrica]|uniref:Flgn protein n=1 Tax=Lucifera butyrica TaxID=1351585 RepID=A0A498RH45_9FIRM|nr:flagellar protein FlgN [Lucifera butyrica]VBB09433.1 flgn protein [Lucifera butyrica]
MQNQAKDVLWENLLAALTAMLDICRTLLTVSEDKQKTLVDGNVDELLTITRQEEHLLWEFEQAGQKRRAATKELDAAFGSPEQSFSPEKLASMAETEEAGRFLAINKEIAGITLKLDKINKLNHELVKQGLTFANFTVGVLTGSKADSTYGPQRQQAPPAQPIQAGQRLFDCKV